MVDNIKEKIEDKVIDCINYGAGGRLIILKPENSDKDLMVEKRGDYKKKPISINVYDKIAPPQMQSFAPDNNFYLVFAHFDIVKQDIADSIYVIPSSKFSDKIDFSKFLINKNNLGGFLIDTLGKTKKSDHSKDFLRKNIV
jgi:hypothetical protein